MADFADDKAFEERFRPHVGSILRRIIADVLADAYVAPEIDDFRHNKDWGLTVDLLRRTGDDLLPVATRIRRADQKSKRNKQGHRFTREFTIRATRPSGRDTELHKMIHGFGALNLYGFEAEPGGDHLYPWVALNLDRFRTWLQSGRRRWREHKPNRDGTSTFVTYWLEDLPPGVVLASEGVPPPLIGAIERSKTDPRYAPYIRNDDWAETTHVHPHPSSPGWACPDCGRNALVFFGQSPRYDPQTRAYTGEDKRHCRRCLTRTIGDRWRERRRRIIEGSTKRGMWDADMDERTDLFPEAEEGPGI